MKQTLVLHYYKSIVDGVMTSLIDAFFDTRKWEESGIVTLKLICPELYLLQHDDYYNCPLDDTQWYEYVDEVGLEIKKYDKKTNYEWQIKYILNKITTAIPFLRYNRNFGDFNLFYSITQDERKFKANNIVCSARLLYEILNGTDIEIECDKLIVLDSLDTYKSKIGLFPNLDDAVPKNCECVYLSNPATFRETPHKQIEWYHKLTPMRLDALKKSGYFHNKDSYHFKRSDKEKTKIESGHFENIGKGIFENAWFKKRIHYSTEGMYMRDGLWYYLNLFGIDGEKDQIIEIDKREIKNRLIFNFHDQLVKELI
jgi:hypothetical protein